jgi:hypothetical protein
LPATTDVRPECLMTSATCLQTTTIATDAPLPAGDPCVASAGIVGGSGYTGALLAELLLKHPSATPAAVAQ